MKHRFFLAAAIMLTLVFICASGQRVPPGLAPTGATPRAADQGIPESLKAGIRVTGDFGRMPLAFIANQGQVDRRAVYYVQGADKAVYFTREGLTYVLSRPDTAGKAMPSLPELGPALANHAAALSWTVKQDFVGANRNVRPVGLERTGTIFSYFRGAKDQWRTGIPSFSRILYPAVWPGIDLTYSGTTSLLKYEFVVKPGADPGSIRLAYRGATAVNLNQAGELEVETPAGGFRDAAPEAYQEIEGKRVPVSVSYALESAAPRMITPTGSRLMGTAPPTLRAKRTARRAFRPLSVRTPHRTETTMPSSPS